MKAIILAGGYAKRLWPLTMTTPKPLLRVGSKPIINYIVESLEKIDEIDHIYVSTNKKFEKQFSHWLKDYSFTKPVEIIIENTNSEETKLGAIGGIDFIIKNTGIDEDCIIIAGDNMFDFSLQEFITFYKEKKGTVMAVFDIVDPSKASLYGIVTLDDQCKVIDFIEKPKDPPSTLVSTACYIFPRDTIKYFSSYLKDGNNKDSPGFFLQWLHKSEDVYGFAFNGQWFDIGDKDSLKKARAFIQKKTWLV